MANQFINALKNIRLNQIILITFLLPFCYTLGQNYIRPFYVLISNKTIIRNGINSQAVSRIQMIKTLQELANLSVSEKRKTLLFIPQSNRVYWDLSNRCEAVPLMIPALTGIAMIDGLPEENCQAMNYGYGSYQLRKAPQSIENTTSDLLCKKAVVQGFSQVIVINTDSHNDILSNKITCFEK